MSLEEARGIIMQTASDAEKIAIVQMHLNKILGQLATGVIPIVPGETLAALESAARIAEILKTCVPTKAAE